MKNNLLYFRGRLNNKIPRSLTQAIEVWLGYGVREGDILERIYVSNKTVASATKVSSRTILRAKNEAEKLGIIERYYDPIAQKDCLKIYLRRLATFLDSKSIKYLPKIFPQDTLESTVKPVNESATILPFKDDELVNESATPCRKPVNESATPCRTNNLNTNNNLINKNSSLFVNNIEAACRESESSVDGTPVSFSSELVESVEAFVSTPPEWIKSESHAKNYILKQIRAGQYQSRPKRTAPLFIEQLPSHAVPEMVPRTKERVQNVNNYFKQMFAHLGARG